MRNQQRFGLNLFLRVRNVCWESESRDSNSMIRQAFWAADRLLWRYSQLH